MGMADAFVRGFGLADAHLARKEQQDMQREELGMRKQAFEQNSELNNLRVESAKLGLEDAKLGMADKDLARRKEQATMILGKYVNGLDLADDEVDFLRKNPRFNPFNLTDERTGSALKALELAATPNSGVSMNDPSVIEGANYLLRDEINKGSGGKKRITNVIPGKQPGTLVFELEVTGDDGKAYNAPMTVGRDSNPDAEILQVPVASVIDRIQGTRVLRQAFMSPQTQQSATKMYKLLGGAVGAKDPVIHEFYDERTGQPYKAQYVNGDWVRIGGVKGREPKNELPASVRAQAEYYQKALTTTDNQLEAATKQLSENMQLTEDEKTELRGEISALRQRRDQYMREYEQTVGLNRSDAPQADVADYSEDASSYVSKAIEIGGLTPDRAEVFLWKAQKDLDPAQFEAVQREVQRRFQSTAAGEPQAKAGGLQDVQPPREPAKLSDEQLMGTLEMVAQRGSAVPKAPNSDLMSGIAGGLADVTIGHADQRGFSRPPQGLPPARHALSRFYHEMSAEKFPSVETTKHLLQYLDQIPPKEQAEVKQVAELYGLM